MGYCNILEVAATVAAVYLVLAPFPVQLAPTWNQDERHRREMVPHFNESANAFTGLGITYRYVRLCVLISRGQNLIKNVLSCHMQIHSHPNISRTSDDEPNPNVRDSMCDLLAYHDLLAETIQTPPHMNHNSTANSSNASQDLLVLLEANIRDTCTWVSSRIIAIQ